MDETVAGKDEPGHAVPAAQFDHPRRPVHVDALQLAIVRRKVEVHVRGQMKHAVDAFECVLDRFRVADVADVRDNFLALGVTLRCNGKKEVKR